MKRRILAAARVGTVIVSGLAFATIAGTGVADAAPQDCLIARNAFSATATCQDADAPAGREYTLVVDCWGLHFIPDRFPFAEVGPYSTGTRWFVPTGQATGNCSESWGGSPMSIGVVTGAHVEIYRQ